ncbi:MAG TPA: ATP-binding protein, partial [Chitinophagaceae bacterium]|nr:ATP-binding protein [Chitinophagaceae bacterium]
WDWDMTTNKKTYNDRWAAMLGYSSDDFNNEDDWRKRIHKDDIKRFNAASDAHIKGETEFYESLFRVQHRDESWLYILDRGKVVEKDANGKPTYFTGTHTDITKEKLAEQKAIEVSHAKSFFMANMSHEIRTPIHGITGIASLLSETNLTDQQKEYVNTIKESGDGLLVVINDILDFSKIEAGKMEISPENFDLHEFVKGVASLFYERIIQKRLLFHVHVEEGTPRIIRADKNRLRQILSNLLNNAIKFTHEGSIELCIKSFFISTLQQPKIMFSVSDTGIGIKSENAGRIFDRFSQEDNSTSRKYGGTGLGLSISKSLINLMDGDMELNSEPGSGSTFSFYIGYEPASVEAEGGLTKEHKAGRMLSILVADDNIVNCMVIKKMIETIGHTPTIVNNGRQALQQMEHKTFDLIFMDLHMPEMDGLEATQKIIEQYTTGRPKIIAITADAYEETKDTCFKIGMDDFLAKPFAKKDLVDIILRASA